MSWHVPPHLLDRYARGSLDDPNAYSVEAHLLECADCRGHMRGALEPGRVDALWTRIEAEIVAVPCGPVERLLLSAGVRDDHARLLAATPSLTLSWLLAVALALAFAVTAAHFATTGLFLFLVVAPLLPVAGVAVAYGRGADPTYEIGVAAPASSFGLLLVRAGAVLATTTALAAVASLMLPDVGWRAAAWLLPSLGLVGISLALSSFTSSRRAAAAVAVSWVAVTMLGTLSTGDAGAVFGGGAQLIAAAVALGSAALLLNRRDAFERGDR